MPIGKWHRLEECDPIPRRTERDGVYWDRIMEIKTRPTDPLLCEEQAAEQLGVKPTTLQVWRCNKRYSLAYVRVGRCIRYRQSAINAFLDARTVEA